MKGLTLGIAVLALAAFGCGGDDTPSVSAAGEQIEDAAKEAGAATINYGVFFNNVISFLIVAFAVFMLVKSINSMKRKEEEKPAPAPPGPSAEEKVLIEIRDALKQRG